MNLVIGNQYKWIHEPQILTYIGEKNGWHIFTFKDRPWCECLDSDLPYMEEVKGASHE